MNISQVLDFGPVTGFRVGAAPLGKPLMSVICYRVDDVLIDTGPGNARKQVVAAVGPESLQAIYLTHYHEDHAGNAGYLQTRFVIPVNGHERTAQMLSKSVKLRPYEKYMWGGLDKVNVTPLAGKFCTRKYDFDVIHTPGHSHDHVVFLERNHGWLFSGDMYLGARIKYFRADEDVYQTIESLKIIAALNFDALFCGHNPQLVEPHKAIQRKIDHLENIIGYVQQLHTKGMSNKAIIKEAVKKRESWLVKLITLGDVSYRNMILSVLHGLPSGDPA
jgi:glyoxylase-like metal-dependent hydrolase (beta-lactamase superfamily II)